MRLPDVLREVRVTRIVDLSPNFRRLVFTGEQLSAFTSEGQEFPAFTSPGFDDHVQLLPMSTDERQTQRPRVEGGRIRWTQLARSRTRSYTVRAFADGELTIDFVNHPGGVAASWAYNCAVGDVIDFVGPSVTESMPQAQWHLVAGDETAVPALMRWLEEAPQGARAQVFAEVPTVEDFLDIEPPANINWTWLTRSKEGPNKALTRAVTEAEWWGDGCHAFIAGESAGVGEIRNYLRKTRSLPRSATRIVGYWRIASLRD